MSYIPYGSLKEMISVKDIFQSQSYIPYDFWGDDLPIDAIFFYFF